MSTSLEPISVKPALRISPFCRGDILIFFAVMVFFTLTLYHGLSKLQGSSYSVYCDDTELHTSKLILDTVEIEHNGFTMVIGSTDSTVEVISSSCPHGVCANSHPISRSGSEIICAPNRVVVKIIDEKSDKGDALDVDIIAR